MSRLRMMLLAVLVVTGSAVLFEVSAPTPVYAAECTSNFLGLPAWYDGLTDSSDNCNVVSPGEYGLTQWIWRIVLNIIEAFLIVVGYVSVAFLIIGGYRYMIATGSPDQIKAAKDTIRNAIVGLVIALGSVAIVNAIAGAIG